MKRFPKVSPSVKPLYNVPNHLPSPDRRSIEGKGKREEKAEPSSEARGGEISANPGANRLAEHGFNYRTSVKILQTKMYEPVSDGVVTIITPKYSIRNAYDHSDGEDDTVSRVEVADNSQSTNTKCLKMLNQSQFDQPAQMTNHCDNRIPSEMGDNCIDVEHINFERNFRNKFKSAGVQTSQLSPYRLRFWPKGASSNLKCIDGGVREIIKCCLKTLSQWFLSQIGLTITLLIWALLGATAFYKTEGPREKQQSEELDKLKNDIAVELSTDLRQTSGHEEAWPKTVEKYLMKHEALLLDAVSAGYGEGGGGSIWTFPGCILFAVALLTTLGFGAPVPRTPLARGAAVLFSAIGIPLHFLLILNMGTLAAGTLQNLATIKPTSELPEVPLSTRQWLKWFPFLSIAFYYTLGVIFFGVLRKRTAVESLMFPLDFTAAGGVAKTSGHVRILYALYLEVAVTLAAIVVSLLQASATRGIIDFGLRLGLLTNT